MPITKTAICPWCTALVTNPEKHQQWHENASTFPPGLTALLLEQYTHPQEFIHDEEAS